MKARVTDHRSSRMIPLANISEIGKCVFSSRSDPNHAGSSQTRRCGRQTDGIGPGRRLYRQNRRYERSSSTSRSLDQCRNQASTPKTTRPLPAALTRSSYSRLLVILDHFTNGACMTVILYRSLVLLLPLCFLAGSGCQTPKSLSSSPSPSTGANPLTISADPLSTEQLAVYRAVLVATERDAVLAV